MAQLALTIAGRVHLVACDEGEEARLGDLAERHLNLAIRPLRAKSDVAYGVEILPVARGGKHHHREMPVACSEASLDASECSRPSQRGQLRNAKS
ncbi:MAG: hypothetical protein ACRECP_00095 [Methylocella sp.]